MPIHAMMHNTLYAGDQGAAQGADAIPARVRHGHCRPHPALDDLW